MKKKKILIVMAAVGLVATVLLFALNRGSRKGPGKGSMKEFVVKRGTIQESIEATGEIKPCTGAEISLGARVTGTVIEEPIKIGDQVKKGDLIAIIDNRALRQAVDKAEADLEKVRATYDNSIIRQEKELERQKLLRLNAQREVEAAKVELSFARWDLKSQKALFSRSTHSTSEKAFRQAQAALARKEAAYRQAQNSLKAAELSVKKAEAELGRLRQEYTYSLKSAQATLNRSEIRMSYSILRAPFAGVISYVSTQEGETVVAGLNAPQFAKILDENRIENRVYVDETEIGKIKKGMRVNFRVDACTNHTYSGRISQIYPAPVLQNNVVYYIAVVDGFGNKPRLRVQMTTHNQIMTQTFENVILVPNSAVRFQDGGYVVIVKHGGKKKTVPVETGVSDSRFTEIKNGLTEGQTVLYRE